MKNRLRNNRVIIAFGVISISCILVFPIFNFRLNGENDWKGNSPFMPDKGKIKDSIYKNVYLGWKFVIPPNYDTIPLDAEIQKKKVISKNVDSKADLDSDVRLLAIKSKAGKSTLICNLQLPNYATNITNVDDFYSQYNKIFEAEFKQTDFKQSVKKSTIVLDNQEFQLLVISLNKGNVQFAKQWIMLKFLKKYIFSITISADNENDSNFLINQLKKSKLLDLTNK